MEAKKLLNILLSKENVAHKIINYKKDEILFYEGQKCKEIVFVLKGEIEMSTIIANTNVVFNHFSKNDVFGNNLIFASNNTYLGTVFSTKASKCILLSKKELKKALKDDEFLEFYMQIISDSIIKEKNRIKIIQLPKLTDRIFELLSMQNNTITFNNIAELSHFFCTSRENLSRTLHKLEKNNKIYLSKHYIKKL